jgi:hypothetical protein
MTPGPFILVSEIQRAAQVTEVIQVHERSPGLYRAERPPSFH